MPRDEREPVPRTVQGERSSGREGGQGRRSERKTRAQAAMLKNLGFIQKSYKQENEMVRFPC